MADQDTDRCIFEVNAIDLRRKIGNLEVTMEWTDLVTMTLQEFHERGGSGDRIESALRNTPFYSAMVRAVRNLKKTADPETIFCLPTPTPCSSRPSHPSEKGLLNLFTEIVTDPAEWDEFGLLRLRRRIDPAGVQHKCAMRYNPNAKNLRPSWNATNLTLTRSGTEGIITIPSYILGAKIQSSADASGDWRVEESKKKAPRMDSVHVWVTNRPKFSWEVEEYFNSLWS